MGSHAHKRSYRVVSLDTAADFEESNDHRSLERLMRSEPTPNNERKFVRTPNGNIVQAVAR